MRILQTENLTVSLVWKDNGKPLYFITVVEDLTKRKLAEDRLELLIEQTRDGFYILDYFGAIFDVNRRAFNSLGFSFEELLAMNISEVDVPSFLISDEIIESLSIQNGSKKEINPRG